MKPGRKPYRDRTREESLQYFIEDEQESDAEKAAKHYNPDPWKEIPALLAFHKHWTLENVRRIRCPECYGEVTRWASLYAGNPYWIYLRCTGHHILRATHGVVIRCPAFEKAASENRS